MSENANKAVVFDIIRASYVDGPGIRTSVFFKGCNLSCAWCHNPESQSPDCQMMLYANKCTSCGKCVKVCPNGMKECNLCGRCADLCVHDARKLCGKEMTVEEIFGQVVRDKLFYTETNGGVTLSGGECMLKPHFIRQLLEKCKSEGIHTAIDTAGCVSWDSFEEVLEYTDLFLYDIKLMNEQKHREYVGVDNKLILSNLARLFEVGARVWVRVPVISGVNDSMEEMLAIKQFLSPFAPEKIELLPYHAMGEYKYTALGREAQSFTKPDDSTMAKLKGVFAD